MTKQQTKRGVVILLSLVALLLVLALPVQAVKYANHNNPKILLFFEENVTIKKTAIDGTNVLFTPIKPGNYTGFYFQSTLTAEKTYYLFVNATGIDNTGYMENFTEAIILDKTSPSLVSSYPIEQSTVFVENGALSIRLAFSEKAKPVKYTFKAANGSNISLAFSTQGYLYNHTATATVSNGGYSLNLLVEDEAGNNKTVLLSFTVVKALDITLIKPKDGASNKTNIDFSVSTNRYATCKYYLNTNNDKTLSTLTESYFTDLTSSASSTVHSVGFWVKDGSEASVFVQCKGGIGTVNLTKREEFKVYVDTTPPVIAVQASDITQPPFVSNVYINSDDPVICRFSAQNTKFDSMDKIGATGIESYVNEYQITNGVADKKSYTYYIGCKNKAGSVVYSSASFVVDTSLSVAINILQPKESYYSSTRFPIKVLTNMDANCSYSIKNTTAYTQSGTFGTVGKNHTSDSITFSQGKNTLYVKCTAERYGSAPVNIIKDKKFYVDTSSPVNFSISLISPKLVDGKTYVSDSFTVNATASDPESGIDYYLFEINSTDSKNYSTGWINVSSLPKAISHDAKGKSLKINDMTKYGIYAVAVNKAGLVTEQQHLYFFIDRSLKPASCKNGLLDKNESDIDCGGSCGLCGDGKSCGINTDCSSTQCKNKLCTAPTCFDGLKNGDETDADCGGLCNKCYDTMLCKTGNDCLSTACSATGQCISANQFKCTNGLKEDSEADIDCGGSCSNKCINGKKCLINDDCLSTNCKDNLCKVPAPIVVEPEKPVCDDPGDFNCNGIPNAWESAHGLDPNDPTSGDQLNKDGITYYEQYMNEINKKPPEPGSSKTIYIILLIVLIIIALLVGFYFLQGKELKIAGKTFRIPVVYKFSKKTFPFIFGKQPEQRSYYTPMSQLPSRQQIPGRPYPQQRPVQQTPQRPMQQPSPQRPMQQPSPQRPVQQTPQLPMQQPSKQYLQQQYPPNYQSKSAEYLKKKEKEREDALGNFDDPKIK
jgi:hypothetical protein